jgi:hypothetical protein
MQVFYFLHIFSNEKMSFELKWKDVKWIFCHFYDIHSNTSEEISNCGFDLHFPGDWWFLRYFHTPIGHLCFFFWEMSNQILCTFFHWAVCLYLFVLFLLSKCSVIWAPYMFWILSLITCSVFEYFSHSVACLFILFIVFPPVQPSNLMQSQFSLLGFVAFLWVSCTKNNCPAQCQRVFLPFLFWYF